MKIIKIKHLEIWKPLIYKGTETNYMISNKGKVMNKFTKNILVPFISNTGYLRVCLFIDGHKHNISIHRYVAIHFIKFNRDLSKQVNHKNGNKLCNDEYNLNWMTSKENMEHAIEHKLIFNEGENNPFNKYKEKFIIKICECLANGLNARDMRKILNIPKDDKTFRYLVGDIRRGHTWKHISINYKW